MQIKKTILVILKNRSKIVFFKYSFKKYFKALFRRNNTLHNINHLLLLIAFKLAFNSLARLFEELELSTFSLILSFFDFK